MADFKTIPNGTEVSWHYRGAIGHGTTAGVHKLGTSSANTLYSIDEHDHHPGESPTVYHYGRALTVNYKKALRKSSDPDRFVLGIAYQAGMDPNIKKGADGYTDFISSEVLEKAAWGYLRGRAYDNGLEHEDGTTGHVDVVESSIYRGPDWEINGVVVKSGDWLLGAILDEPTWELVKAGKFTGWSPQGKVSRRARSQS